MFKNDPYIIAEMNTSHFGDIQIAKKMIQEAKVCGCDCVKFQSWSEETLYTESYYKENPLAKRFFKKLSLSESELLELSKLSKELQIDFSSTPYSEKEVDFLIEKCRAPFVKIASMDLNNFPFLEYIAETQIPVILSTGMGDIKEIYEAVEIFERFNNKNLCLLHCTSLYPCNTSEIQLNNILGLKEQFPKYSIGFSDHSIGIEIPIASIALGASVIEKHFTLDKSKIGFDNQIAMEPNEMKALVDKCRIVKEALGHKERIVSDLELEQRKKMRRSIITSRDLNKDTKITISCLDFKRPGTGIPPNKVNEVIGKVLVKDLKAESILEKNDIKER